MPARRRVPFEFVLDALTPLRFRTNPMFGCMAVYVDDRIVLILRERGDPVADDGVWVATTPLHHESLRAELPSLRSIGIFGPGPTGWQNIPMESPTFESEALRACELILSRDARIGKVPSSVRRRRQRR
jgi:hypothetical protein